MSYLRVRRTAELNRILALARREKPCEDLTPYLRTPEGEMSLRPVQSQALFEIGTEGGLFGPMRVGAGKTLISLLAGTVAFAERPLLLVPAKLIKKTQREGEILKQHWRFTMPKIMSYELLGRVQSAEALHEYSPDLIICDECHKLRNKRAAVTRRVMRYLGDNQDTKVVAMSGTITKRSLHDFAHILFWCKRDGTPLPRRYVDLQTWGQALDQLKFMQTKAHPGELRLFCNDTERKLWNTDAVRAARLAVRRRLVETPGVVATKETPIDASLSVRLLKAESADIDKATARLEKWWELPDGRECIDKLEVWRHMRELALGFYYMWDPEPPPEWMKARKAWGAFVRNFLNRSRKLDSELQVRNHVMRHGSAGDLSLLKAWTDIKDSFVPNTVPVWLTDDAVDRVREWAYSHRGIVWTEHRCFSERLDITHYGRRGMNSAGGLIEDHKPGEPLSASVQSNAEGRNLQAWSKNLIVSAPPNGTQWEQLIGRTHRDGQTADEVSFDVLYTHKCHRNALEQAIKDSRYVQDTTGSPQKLILADVSM